MDKTNLYRTPLSSRRADPFRRVCGLRETRQRTPERIRHTHFFFFFLRFFFVSKIQCEQWIECGWRWKYFHLHIHWTHCSHWILPTFLVFWCFCVFLYPVKWGFQFYPLSLYILSNGVFSFIPFLYKWTRLIFTELLLAVAAQTRPGGSAVCARQDRGFFSMDKTNLYTTPLISRRADPSRRVCDLRETR